MYSVITFQTLFMKQYPNVELSILFAFHSNLNRTIFPILKDSVSLFNILQTIPVGDKRCSVNQSLLDQREYLRTVAFIHTASLESEVLTVHIWKRKHLRTVIKCDYCDDCIRAGRLPSDCKLPSDPATSMTTSAPPLPSLYDSAHAAHSSEVVTITSG